MKFTNIFSFGTTPAIMDSGNPKDKKIIKTIKRNTNRTSQSTLNWRNAIEQAENPYYPYRTLMIEIFQDTILNSQVIAGMERRKDLTLLRNFEFKFQDGTEDKTTYELIDKVWFRKFLSYSLDSIFYGYTMVNLGSIVENEFPHLQITRREFVSPDKNLILAYPTTPTGTDITEAKYKNWNILIQTNNPAGVSSSGYGLLYPVSLLEIYIRNLLGLNADFVELYTQPFRLGKTDKTNEEERDFLEDMLANFGSNGWGLMDKEDSIEFLDTNSNGSTYEAYSDFENRLEKKISKILLGHADALDSVPGKLGAGSGEDNPVAIALRDKRNMDAMFIENIINNELIPRMNNLGFNIKSKFKFKNDDEKVEETKFITNIAVEMAKGGLLMDEKYFTEKTGIPTAKMIIKNGDK